MSYQDDLDISIVRQHVRTKYTTQRAAANALGIHEARVSEALNGLRPMPERMLLDAGIHAPPIPAPAPNSRMAPAGYTRLTVNLRDDLHKELKLLAIADRVTAGQLIERWVKRGLEEMVGPGAGGIYETPQFNGANTWDGGMPCIPTCTRWHSRLYRWLRKMVRRA